MTSTNSSSAPTVAICALLMNSSAPIDVVLTLPGSTK